jgi:hypothetical protein
MNAAAAEGWSSMTAKAVDDTFDLFIQTPSNQRPVVAATPASSSLQPRVAQAASTRKRRSNSTNESRPSPVPTTPAEPVIRESASSLSKRKPKNLIFNLSVLLGAEFVKTTVPPGWEEAMKTFLERFAVADETKQIANRYTCSTCRQEPFTRYLVDGGRFCESCFAKIADDREREMLRRMSFVPAPVEPRQGNSGMDGEAGFL